MVTHVFRPTQLGRLAPGTPCDIAAQASSRASRSPARNVLLYNYWMVELAVGEALFLGDTRGCDREVDGNQTES